MRFTASPSQCCTLVTMDGPPKDLSGKEKFAFVPVFVKGRMEGVLKRILPTKVLPTATSVELERSPEVQARINNCCGEGFLFSFYGADGFAAVAES